MTQAASGTAGAAAAAAAFVVLSVPDTPADDGRHCREYQHANDDGCHEILLYFPAAATALTDSLPSYLSSKDTARPPCMPHLLFQ